MKTFASRALFKRAFKRKLDGVIDRYSNACGHEDLLAIAEADRKDLVEFVGQSKLDDQTISQLLDAAFGQLCCDADFEAPETKLQRESLRKKFIAALGGEV